MAEELPSDMAGWPNIDHFPDNTILADRYELLELIGRGWASRIYRGRDRVLNRLVAIKLLRAEYGSDENLVTRFSREARAVAALSNPHIVQVYDYGQFNNTYFIVLQYVHGYNLKELLQREGSLPANRAVEIVDQILQGLETAHQQGIIHRDVKPSNVLIQSSNGVVLLSDFGVARILNQDTITQHGTMIGTVSYMAPEQVSGGRVGPPADIYSVGVVLFEILSGRVPFQGNNQMQVSFQHLYEPAPLLSSLGVRVPPGLEQVVQRALVKNPAGRFQSAAEMRRALLASLQNPAPAYLEPTLNGSGPPGYQVTAFQNNPKPPPVTSAPEPAYSNTFTYNSPSRLWLVLVPLLLIVAGIGLFWLLSSTLFNRASTSSVASSPAATTSIIVTSPARATAVAAKPVTTTAAPPVTSAATTTQQNRTNPPPATGNVSPLIIDTTQLNGAYRRDDGTLYGRQEVALYGAGSGYDQTTVSFSLDKATATRYTHFRILGIDDERAEHCTIEITLNGILVYRGPDSLPNAPDGDNGEGGPERYWNTMDVTLPSSALKAGANTLVIRNTTAWTGRLGPPWLLVSSFEFSGG